MDVGEGLDVESVVSNVVADPPVADYASTKELPRCLLKRLMVQSLKGVDVEEGLDVQLQL